MKTQPKLLDLFCGGGGGAAMGYYRAGFDVVGVDIVPQPKYPFKFVQADVFEYMESKGHLYDMFHASPPCQRFSTITPEPEKHPDLIAKTRLYIQARNKPYVIENGMRAPLIEPTLMLCGTMFGLLIVRHRKFEIMPPLFNDIDNPMYCKHTRKVVKHGRRPDRAKHYAACTGHFSDVEFGKQAMGIDWLGQKGLAQAIPPAYTQYIGEQLLKVLA